MSTPKLFVDKLIIVLPISIVGGIVLSFLTCPACFSSFRECAYDSMFSASIWLTLWMGNTFMAEYLDTKISWIDAPGKRLLVGITGTIVFSTVAVALLLLIWRPLLSFELRNEIMLSVIITSLVITFIISLIMHSRAFLINWKLSLINVEKFKRESVAAQYESLKSQVNPHFLFNSLNALTNLVYEDQNKAAKFIKQLSEVYRYVLDTREKEVVPLEEELKFLHSYIFLQEIRFGNNLKIEMNLNQANIQVAPLALQLLIENAIKHNVVSSEDPLHLRLYLDGDYIVVENNLQKKLTLGEPTSGLGLENIRQRYSFLSNKQVLISEADGKFSVKLPIINLEDERTDR
jgi:sensor histidine kinase YesM